MSVLMRCFQRAARIVPPPSCRECSSGTPRAASRERCGASRPTGRLRVLEASGSRWAVRARRRCREGVDLADPQCRHGAPAPDGPGELPAGEGAFRVGFDELLEGGLVDEHGVYGPSASGRVVGSQGVVELDAGRAGAPAGAGEQSADGLAVRPGGVGVGIEANGSEVVGRGVLVGESVDRGEGGRCAGSAAPALDGGLVGARVVRRERERLCASRGTGRASRFRDSCSRREGGQRPVVAASSSTSGAV